METKKKAPERHNELRDPKLPAIHAQSHGNQAENRVNPAPIPQQQSELNQNEL